MLEKMERREDCQIWRRSSGGSLGKSVNVEAMILNRCLGAFKSLT